MDKLAKSIILYLTDQPDSAGLYCEWLDGWERNIRMTMQDLCTAVGAEEKDVRRAVEYLVEHKFLAFQPVRIGDRSVNVAFRLRHEGIHFREIRYLTTRSRILHWLSGVASGVAITLIVQYVVRLLA